MKKIATLIAFEAKRMVRSKNTFIYTGILLIDYLLLVLVFKYSGSEDTVLTVGNAQSMPIQLLSGNYLFIGVFTAIYTAQLLVQECSQGTVKLVLLRSVTRLDYFISRVSSILIFNVFMTLITLVLSYTTGWVAFGWGEQLLFNSISASGIEGVVVTLLAGLAFAFACFVFGLLALVVGMFVTSLVEAVAITSILLIAGEFLDLFPNLKRLSLTYQIYFFHVDLLEQPLAHNLINVAILAVYCVALGLLGYFLFRKRDLYV